MMIKGLRVHYAMKSSLVGQGFMAISVNFFMSWLCNVVYVEKENLLVHENLGMTLKAMWIPGILESFCIFEKSFPVLQFLLSVKRLLD